MFGSNFIMANIYLIQNCALLQSFDSLMSRADFWQISAVGAVKGGIRRANQQHRFLVSTTFVTGNPMFT
jgi:hypothetical protein